MMAPVYTLTLHPSYYEKGFFNLGVDVERFVRGDDGPITLLLGDARRQLDGRVSRKANTNGTPRIHGGTALRDWFFGNFSLGDTVAVHVEAPDRLWLRHDWACGMANLASAASQGIEVRAEESPMNPRMEGVRDATAKDVEVTRDELKVALGDGRTITAPLAWYPRLLHGSARERASWRLIGGGIGIHWEVLDEDVSIDALLAGSPSGESQPSLERWLARRRSP